MTADLAAALERLRAQDAAAAARAEALVTTLTRWGPQGLRCGMVLEGVLTHRVAERPEQVAADVDALARVFELAGRDDAARCCRDPAWTAAAAAARSSPEAHRAAVERLLARPRQPPVLVDFQWDPEPGPVEHQALLRVADVVDSGADGDLLGVGGDGDDPWERRRAVLRAVLEQPAPGSRQTWRDAIEHERLTAWARSEGPGRAALVDALLDDLARAVPTPPDAATVVDELRAWLQAPSGRVRIADEVAALARRVGLVVAGSAEAALLGRTLALDSGGLWQHLCRWALTPDTWRDALAELVWLQLLRDPCSRGDLIAGTVAIGMPEGRFVGRDPDTGAPRQADAATAGAWAREVVDACIRLGTALHLLTVERGRHGMVRLSDVGWWTVLAMLRGRAVGPRREFQPLPPGNDR